MRSTFLALATALLPAAQAGWNPNSHQNIVVYWGQNSANVDSAQQRLSYYCQNAPNINVIDIAFLVGINTPELNLANAGNNCTAFPNSQLFSCPQIEADIETCQSTYGKTIILSLGGSTYAEGGFNTTAQATAAAQNVWNMFGPVQSGSSALRPFGNAVVDGFDFDLESSVKNMEPFAAQLRSLINGYSAKKMYLSAAPQCPYPDLADEGFIDGQVDFDWVQVQFYNNYCSVGLYPNGWDYSTWDTWAKTVSSNKNAKVLVGIPAATGAANGGSYASGSTLANALNNAKGYSSFAGVMMWDMSRLFQNSGFLNEVVSDLGGSAPPPPPPSTTLTTSTTAGGGSSPTGVPQWGQCGGQGYNGPTQCQPPYKCVSGGQWWSSCQ